jgi:hypothetical protein
MMMIVEQFVEWRLAGETEVLGENLPQRHFVHQKSHMTRPGLEPRATALGSQRLTAWAMARPVPYYVYDYSSRCGHRERKCACLKALMQVDTIF